MQAFKGSWAGQTFAMATGSDSGARKSRIRRSKGERKTMVESFIQKYQKLNNGSFPSLNLTHKEVGGSFYTVREIVREIIQENRILGPVKLPHTEYDDTFLEQYPLGSISIEPHSFLSSTQKTDAGTHIAPNYYRGSSEDDLNSNGKFQVALDDDQITNESGMLVKNIDEPIVTDDVPTRQDATKEQFTDINEDLPMPDNPKLDIDQVLSGSKSVEVVEKLDLVDNVPITSLDATNLRSDCRDAGEEQISGVRILELNSEQVLEVTDQSVNKDEDSESMMRRKILDVGRNGAEEHKELIGGETQVTTDIVVETFPLRPISQEISGFSGRLYEITNGPGALKEMEMEKEKVNHLKSPVTQLAGTLESNDNLVDVGRVHIQEEPSSKGSNFSMAEDASEPHINVDPVAQYQDVLSAGTRHAESSSGIPNENLHNVGINQLPTAENVNMQENKPHRTQQKGSDPTLHRMNLETWKEESKESGGTEVNPLLALFKAFFSAFVKFWTE